nr:unnamed protein product [Callosobruchus analis]
MWHNNMALLGDSGYGIRRCLMTPYRNPETREEIAFNALFTEERVIIETCFGQLKRRLPISQYMVRAKLDRVVSVIISCSVPHKYLNDIVSVDGQEDDINDEEGEEHNSENEDENVRRRGLQRRKGIKNLVYQLQH